MEEIIIVIKSFRNSLVFFLLSLLSFSLFILTKLEIKENKDKNKELASLTFIIAVILLLLLSIVVGYFEYKKFITL